MNLTSQNANEVIQKRLLEKTADAASDLGSIYSKIQNSLSSIICRSIIDFFEDVF